MKLPSLFKRQVKFLQTIYYFGLEGHFNYFFTYSFCTSLTILDKLKIVFAIVKLSSLEKEDGQFSPKFLCRSISRWFKVFKLIIQQKMIFTYYFTSRGWHETWHNTQHNDPQQYGLNCSSHITFMCYSVSILLLCWVSLYREMLWWVSCHPFKVHFFPYGAFTIKLKLMAISALV